MDYGRRAGQLAGTTPSSAQWWSLVTNPPVSIRTRSAASGLALRFFAIAVLMTGPGSVLACSCAAFPAEPGRAIAIAYPRADVIFTGTPIAVKTRFFRLPPVRETAFRVHAQWKGEQAASVTVRTTIGESACGIKFQKNTAYLVFGYWNSQKSLLTTSMCELTRPENAATELIRELEAIAK